MSAHKRTPEEVAILAEVAMMPFGVKLRLLESLRARGRAMVAVSRSRPAGDANGHLEAALYMIGSIASNFELSPPGAVPIVMRRSARRHALGHADALDPAR